MSDRDRGILSSLRYLFADFIGEEDDTPPVLPEGLPESVAAVAGDAIHLLIDYQDTGYAQLYVDRLRRFVGKPGVDAAMLTDIARLMAARMSYEDPIRLAQLKLAALAAHAPRSPSSCSMRWAGQAGHTRMSRSGSARRVGSAFAGSRSRRDCAGGDGIRCATPRNGSGSNAGCI